MDKDLEKVLSYSLDQLDEKEKAEFEKDLNSNTELDKELQEMQSILETLALAEEPVKPSENLKRSLIASLDVNTPFHGFVDRFMKLFDLDRDNVEALFSKVVNTPDDFFKSCAIPKTSLSYFDGGPKVSHAECGIIKIEAGSIFPAHKHQGKEWVLVLQGEAVDQSGQAYFPGDIIYSDEKVSHALRVNKASDLIFAVVLEKPNKWLIGQIVIDYLFPNFRFKKNN